MKTTLTKDDPAGWYLCEFNGAERCFWWDGEKLRRWPGDEYLHYINYTNFRRLFTEEEVAGLNYELQKLRAANERLSATLLESSAELSALKAFSYPMRKADKPDCVGLWRDKDGVYYEATEQTLPHCCDYPTYYLGPIPVIPKEQKPPQVVKVKCKVNSITMRAIPYGDDFVLLNRDGTIAGNASKDNWEVVK